MGPNLGGGEMMRQLTEYEIFQQAAEPNRRLLCQEAFILEATEKLSEALEGEGITKAELANRLGTTKGFVSQVLAGGRNLTLRTIADFSTVLGCEPRIEIHRLTGRMRLTEFCTIKPLTLEGKPWGEKQGSAYHWKRPTIQAKPRMVPQREIEGVA